MGRKGNASRARILDKGSELIHHGGFAQTSFADLADALGMTKGHFYYYYRSKDDLLRDIVAARSERISAMLTEWSGAEPDPQARILRFIDMVAGQAEMLREHGCPMGSLSGELSKGDAHLQSEGRAMFDLFIHWLAEQFATRFDAQTARAHAEHLMIRAQGASLLAHVYGDADKVAQECARMRAWLNEMWKGSDKSAEKN
ncbi:TetR/AcrR family transcriptional regulator [Magnetofaba australis]|uniref:Putative TetR family transcriptional regulator n=1 Tax=Magnetofaba australis IT-1 TaxID=1434232 RepID=A0A1Y2K1U4_9PROT|nr:TetR/AcrR family transcriptional regulator [Magnetofaba australis]OSM01988.1 putative TetR family transcriptional regulator [Magnetofaba australis IT-1]